VRRYVVTSAVVGVLALGAVGWMLRPSSASALDRACSTLGNAFRAQGPGTRDDIVRAGSAAQDAAKKDARLRAFADAVGRLGVPVTTGVGAVVRPPDLTLIDATCHRPPVPPGVSIATRTPYLTDVTENSVLVNFATDAALTSPPTVSYGLADHGCGDSQATALSGPTAVLAEKRTDYLYSIELTGLTSGTRYCYRLGGPVLDLSTKEIPPTFVTAPAVGDSTPYSFAVIGDWGGGTPDETNVLARIASSPASFLVTVGDNAYISGNQTDYGDLTSGHVFGPAFWPELGGRIPTFASQGNHGFSLYPSLLQNWPEPRTVAASKGSDRRADYCCISTLTRKHHYANTRYAFDRGPARFYVLDGAWADSTGHYTSDFLGHWNGRVPGCRECGLEQRWLQADLAAHRSTTLKFAFFHYPLYSDASDHPSDQLLDGPNHLEGLLAHNGVDIVFNGHSHLYERNTPQIPGSPMLSYITGAGGVGNGTDRLAAVKHCSTFDAYAIGTQDTSCHAPKPTSDKHVYHFLLVTVAGHRVTVAPTDETGHTFDVRSYTF
jgi:Calcineurin-like phosphoesterase/Purple acid Phosphatase, N-terminal domain